MYAGVYNANECGKNRLATTILEFDKLITYRLGKTDNEIDI